MFCPKLKSQVRAALRGFDSYLNEHIDIALKVTKALKSFISSPVADLLTAVIPGDLDDVIRRHLEKGLEKAVEALATADSCKLYADPNDKLKCFARQLSQRHPELRDAILLKLASILAGELDSRRFQQHIYDLYTQAKFSSEKQ